MEAIRKADSVADNLSRLRIEDGLGTNKATGDDLHCIRIKWDEFWTILEHWQLISDDWRWWRAKSKCLGTNSVHYRKLRENFGSIWDIGEKILAIGDEFGTFVADLWWLWRIEAIIEARSQSYRDHYRFEIWLFHCDNWGGCNLS